MTKAEAVKELEARGISVPADWSAKKVKDVLAEVETVEVVPEPLISAPASRFVTTQTGNSPRG